MFCARFSTEKLSPICFLVSIQQELLATNWNFLEYIFGIFSDDCFGKAEIQKERILRSMFHSLLAYLETMMGRFFRILILLFKAGGMLFERIFFYICVE